MVKTPVLFETFVRVDYARQVWDAIKAAQPKTLYFYSNKGRAEKEGEIARNNEIRSWIKEIDWDCNLHTWFRDECVDVYTSLRGAISWLFDNEEAGIILEDDCVPTKSFFSFVDQMIVKFKDEPKVWCISGDNFIDESLVQEDYYFSHYHYMYGWATWAHIWKSIDLSLSLDKTMIKNLPYKELYKTNRQTRYRKHELYKLQDFVNKTKCWDYLFGFFMDGDQALTVHPKYHLITNIGLIGENHLSGDLNPINKVANPVTDIYNIEHEPVEIKVNLELDYNIYLLLQYTPFWKNVKSSLKYRIPYYFNKFVGKLK